MPFELSTTPALERDGCIVTAEPFAEAVAEHVQKWNKNHPQPGGSWVPRTELPPIQALVWLSAECCRIAGSPKAVPVGTLERLIAPGERRHETIELRAADAIALALDVPYLWCDERIKIMPNQRAPKSRWAECCGSSTVPIAV